MSATTVHVKSIPPQTEDKEIRDFFSFCGKINDIDVKTDGETKSATVTFEKETAAKTALLLNNTQLGPSHISVTSASGASHDDVEKQPTSNAERDSDEITQEEKPRSRILAEYLAHGYVIGDAALQRGIELDQQHGVSHRFMTTLTNLDQKYHASDRAKTADQSYGITSRATGLFSSLNSYFEKATATPTGQKLVEFYTQSQKQVADVHNEARRLAELKKKEHGGDAVKASGLEKVLNVGKAKTGAEGTSSGSSEHAAPGAGITSETSTPAKPAEGGIGLEKPATIPQ